MSADAIIRDLQKRLRVLEDKEELASFMNHYCNVADTYDWKAWGECFTEDATFDFPPVGVFMGRDSIREGTTAWIMYEATLHYLTNVQFDVKGDTATGTAYLRYAGVVKRENPKKHFDFGGPYRWDFRRTTEGWKVCKLKLETSWTAGEEV